MRIESQRDQWPDRVDQYRLAADWSQPKYLDTPLHDKDSRPEFYHPDEYTNRRHFSPTDFNPPADSPVRPRTKWKPTAPEQPVLDLDLPSTFTTNRSLSEGEINRAPDVYPYFKDDDNIYPVDRQPQKLYRGVRLPMDHPALAQFTRSLYGPEYSTKSHGDGLFPQPEHTADPRGWNNTDLGQHVLDYLRGGHRHREQGVGRHWSVDHDVAKDFAGQADSNELSAIISADWMGRGEDPYRTDTYGDYNSEDELTMMGGAPLDIRDIKLQHPETKQWHSIYDISKPQQVTAAFGDPSAEDDDEYEYGFYDGQDFDAQPQFGYTSTPMFPDERPTFEHPDKGYFVPHYSPREINPPSNAPSRPDVWWERGNRPQNLTLPMNYYDISPNRPNLPIDRNPVKLYRGINLNLNDPELQNLRRFLHGDALEDDDPFTNDYSVAPHSGGYYRNEKADLDYLPLELDRPGMPTPSNKALSRKKPWQPGEDTGDMHQQILDFMQRGGRGMGTHWSTDKDQAMQFARSNGWGGKANLPVVITHDWYGSGEDPYRTGTEGEWSEEKEITKLPGSSINVSGVEMYHNPGGGVMMSGWHPLYRGKPIPRLAAVSGYTITRGKDDLDGQVKNWHAHDDATGDLAGYLRTTGEGDRHAIVKIQVLPQHQRKGVASSLWEAAGRPAHTPDNQSPEGRAWARAVGDSRTAARTMTAAVTVPVGSQYGLHTTPSMLISIAVKKTGWPVFLSDETGNRIDARDPMGIMSLGAQHGASITVHCDHSEIASQIADYISRDHD